MVATASVRRPRPWLNSIVMAVHRYPSRSDARASKGMILINCLFHELYNTPVTPNQTTHHP